MKRQVLLFLFAGGIAAAANFGSRIALSQVMPYVPAVVLAYLIGMLTAFVLNRSLVFKDSTNSMHSQATWFVVINLFAIAQTLVISVLLARWLVHLSIPGDSAQTLAHAAGVAFPVFTSFVGHKYLSFRTR
jgi:putative flippase GtrA